MNSRYITQGTEVEFESGSRGRVLRNLIGIRSARAMAQAESAALLATQRRLVERFSSDHRFTAANLSHDQLQQLSGEVGTERSLLVLCTAFRGRGEYPNLTVKKIPRQVLSRCERGLKGPG